MSPVPGAQSTRERVERDEDKEALGFFFFLWTSDVILAVTVISGMGRAKGEGAGCGFWVDSPRKAES